MRQRPVLWYTPPEPAPDPVPGEEPSQAHTVPWQLIAITTSKDGDSAAIYSEAEDRVFLAREGDERAGYVIARIELDRILVVHGDLEQVLTLPKDARG